MPQTRTDIPTPVLAAGAAFVLAVLLALQTGGIDLWSALHDGLGTGSDLFALVALGTLAARQRDPNTTAPQQPTIGEQQ